VCVLCVLFASPWRKGPPGKFTQYAIVAVPLLDHGLEPGDVGVVVHVYPRHEAYEVEFVTLGGQTAAVVTASADQIRPIGKHEIPHARELAPH
jgi:hypothetical protein